MVALVVFIIFFSFHVFDSLDIIIILLTVFFLVRAFKATLRRIVVRTAGFAAESCFGFAHLVKSSSVVSVTFIVIFEDFILQRLVMVLLQLVND